MLQHLGDEVRAEFLEAMDTAQLVAAADDMDTDDFADIPQQATTTISEQVPRALLCDSARVEAVPSFPEDSAGGLMDTDPITVRPDIPWSWCCAIRGYAKSCHRASSPHAVNSEDQHLGTAFNQGVDIRPRLPCVRSRTVTPRLCCVDRPDNEIARTFSGARLISAAVVDDDGRLLGRITIDDVVDVIIEDAEEAVGGPPVWMLMKTPLPQCAERFVVERYGLGINLLTAFAAAAVISAL